MSGTCAVQIWGPLDDGAFGIEPIADDFYYNATPSAAKLEAALRWLNKTIRACISVGADWELRGDDERAPLVENLRAAGHNLFEVFSHGECQDEIQQLLRSASLLSARTGAHIPWEFLYLGKLTGPVDMSQFLGARAAVGRPFEAGKRSKPVNNASLLPATRWDAAPAGGEGPFGLAEDLQLLSARSGAERDMFKRQGQAVMPLKSLRSTPAGWVDLEEFLAQSTVLTHFNSHADDDFEGVDGKPTSVLFVTNQFSILLDRIGGLPVCEQSIVFLNACNAASLKFDKQPSLATAFAKERVQAVVAPTERVGDAYATQWAERFYLALRSGKTVPQAVLQARQDMLARDGNPMALLYAYLGRDTAALPQTVEAA